MSSDTLAKSAAVPETPDGPDLPRIVPQRRLGQWTAAAAVLVLLGLAVNSVLTTAALAILCDALLVLLRRVLTPWMPRGSGGGPRAAAASQRPEAEVAAR